MNLPWDHTKIGSVVLTFIGYKQTNIIKFYPEQIKWIQFMQAVIGGMVVCLVKTWSNILFR